MHFSTDECEKYQLSFVLKVVKHCVFLRGSGSDFQTGGPKQRKIFSQRSQKRNEELSADRCQESAASRGTVWMKKVRNIR